MNQSYSQRNNCARGAKAAMRKLGVEAVAGVDFEIVSAGKGLWTWIDLRASETAKLASQNDPEPMAPIGDPPPDAIDRSPPVAEIGDRVGITGRKGAGLVQGVYLDSKSGEWIAAVQIGGKLATVPLKRVSVIERAADAGGVLELAAKVAAFAAKTAAAVAKGNPPKAPADDAGTPPTPVDVAPKPAKAAKGKAKAPAKPKAPEAPVPPTVAECGVAKGEAFVAEGQWYVNLGGGTAGPFASEADALAALAGGDEPVEPEWIDPADYGLTPETAAAIAAMGDAVAAAKAEAVAAAKAANPKAPRVSMVGEAIKGANGTVPLALVFKSKANPGYQKHADALYALAVAVDRDGLAAYPIKGVNTYAKALQRWRDAALAALDKILAVASAA